MIANYSDAMAELNRTAAENERLHDSIATLKARYHELDQAYSEECLRSSNQEDRMSELRAVVGAARDAVRTQDTDEFLKLKQAIEELDAS